jgi:hypothetical protein
MHSPRREQRYQVGIELGRAGCRWGLPSSLFRLRGGFTFPPRPRLPRPPYNPGRSNFSIPVFALAFPERPFRDGRSLKRSLAFTPTHSGLPLDSSLKDMAPPAFAVDHIRTAKCPELLCRARALLVPGWCPAPPRRALPLLLRSYELMRQTSSLRRTSCFHTYSQRSWQVAASPCWKLILPDVTLQVFPRMLEP